MSSIHNSSTQPRLRSREVFIPLSHNGRGPLDADHGFQLYDAGCDLDEAQAQGIELDGAPDEAFRHPT